MSRRIWLERLQDVLFPLHYSFGSRHTVLAKHVPELELKRGLSLIKECVRACLYDLGPQDASNRKVFMLTIMVSFNLGFTFDHSIISSYVSETRIVSASVAPAAYLVRQPGGDNVINNLMEYYRGRERFSFSAGVAFMRCVDSTLLCI